MALVKTVTKESVRFQKPDLYYDTVKMVVTDDTVEVINQTFTINHRTGQDVEQKVKDLRDQMQELIDNYIAEQIIYNHPKFDTAVTWLNNNLTGGV